MNYTGLITTMVVIIICKNVASGFNHTIQGIVLDNQTHNPIYGAIVTINGTSQRDTTGLEGKFQFSATELQNKHSLPRKKMPTHIAIKKSVLFLDNPKQQKLTLSLFNLHGKRISLLYDGILKAGQSILPLPPLVNDQFLIFQMQTESIKESFMVSGLFSSTVKTGIHMDAAKKMKYATEIAEISDSITVTHYQYDENVVPISNPKESLVIPMYKKLKTYMLNTIKIGDTLSSKKNGIAISLNSIDDTRCPYDSVCTEKGSAQLKLTLIKDGVSHPLTLQNSGQREVIVDGFIVYLENVYPIYPQLNDSAYRPLIAVYSENKTKVLFMEHFQYINGVNASGKCGFKLIDFPNYWYDIEAGLLRLMHIMPRQFNDSTKVLFGSGTSLSGTSGGGTHSVVFQDHAQTFPIVFDEHFDEDGIKGDLTIGGIDEDGTVTLFYLNDTLSIASNTTCILDSSYTSTTSECQKTVDIENVITNFGFLYPYQIW